MTAQSISSPKSFSVFCQTFGVALVNLTSYGGRYANHC
jgi:hypothetical protein